MKTLESSVAELHQMFLDFALLVEQQGEILDDIEFNVTTAVDYVDEGNEKVIDSIKLQRKLRKKQLVMILIGAAVVTVLIVIFVV